MFFLRFLRDNIPPGDQVMHDFVEHMLPNLFALYADTSAKGGDQRDNQTVKEEIRQKFADKGDQSMVSHLLNGIFPTLRLLALLAAEGLGSAFSDVERRIYILSYLMHDIDKILMHEPSCKARRVLKSLRPGAGTISTGQRLLSAPN